MYAVIATGGKQYRVAVGDDVFVEKIDQAEGETVTFSEILALSDDSGLKTGNPYLEGVTVEGEVIKQGRQKKIIVFKYKAKKRYRKKQGHRQPYTRIRINKINA